MLVIIQMYDIRCAEFHAFYHGKKFFIVIVVMQQNNGNVFVEATDMFNRDLWCGMGGIAAFGNGRSFCTYFWKVAPSQQ